jgi:putative membrane protein
VTDRRFPASVFDVGTEPDARFSLANERTFLAWIRTGLALLAGGVALEALGLGIHPGFRLSASLLLLLAGIATPAQAWFGWKRTERALRLGRPLPSAALTVVLAVILGAVGVLVFLGVLFR